jgi:hypothetical protein
VSEIPLIIGEGIVVRVLRDLNPEGSETTKHEVEDWKSLMSSGCPSWP